MADIGKSYQWLERGGLKRQDCPQWPAVSQALRAEWKYQSYLKVVDGKVVKEHCSSLIVIVIAFAIFTAAFAL